MDLVRMSRPHEPPLVLDRKRVYPDPSRWVEREKTTGTFYLECPFLSFISFVVCTFQIFKVLEPCKNSVAKSLQGFPIVSYDVTVHFNVV